MNIRSHIQCREMNIQGRNIMVENEHTQWHWQEPGSAWKGVGIYHVTLTVTSREPLLGKLVIPKDDPKRAYIQRTELGNALVDKLLSHPSYYPEIRVLQFCLMPDHLHAIIHVTHSMDTSIRSIVRSLWQGAKKLGKEYTSSLVPESDSGTNNKDDSSYPFPIFTERPFIRVLTHREQLQTMYDYIRLNPQRLATKRMMHELFLVQEGIEIAGRIYKGVGNVELLQADRFMPVHVRGSWVEDTERHGYDKPLRDYMNCCVISARQGAVMVSPFISKHEKMVQEVLLIEKLPFILIADNGFRDYYKPAASLFDAVAEGRVLILSPWNYDADKRHISRSDCVALNGMAEEICNYVHSPGLNS